MMNDVRYYFSMISVPIKGLIDDRCGKKSVVNMAIISQYLLKKYSSVFYER